MEVADKTGYTPLLNAVFVGNVQAVKMLLDLNASTTIKTKSHLAAKELALYQFSRTGDATFRTIGKMLDDCETEREIARLAKIKTEKEQFEKEQADLASSAAIAANALRRIIEENDMRYYDWRMGFPVDLKFTNGSTPLLYAAKFNRTQIVEDQLAIKASVESRDDDYHTPLTVASVNGNVETVVALLKHMTPEQIKMTAHGKTAYELAKEAAAKIAKLHQEKPMPEYERQLKKYEQILMVLDS